MVYVQYSSLFLCINLQKTKLLIQSQSSKDYRSLLSFPLVLWVFHRMMFVWIECQYPSYRVFPDNNRMKSIRRELFENLLERIVVGKRSREGELPDRWGRRICRNFFKSCCRILKLCSVNNRSVRIFSKAIRSAERCSIVGWRISIVDRPISI